MECVDCGKYTKTTYGKYGYIPLCDDCADKRLQTELDEKSHSVQKASDFSGDTEICLSFSGCTLVDMLRNQMSTASR